jgi:hypothetical protein
MASSRTLRPNPQNSELKKKKKKKKKKGGKAKRRKPIPKYAFQETDP